MIEKGVLPVGVTFNGSPCKEFELRKQRAEDYTEAFEDHPDRFAKAQRNVYFFDLCMLSKRIRIKGIPDEEITPELFLDMFHEDYEEMAEAALRLAKRENEWISNAGAKALPDRLSGAREGSC